MILKNINHLAFITNDMVKTIRFYRDLLQMKLSSGIGHDGYRHYFFQLGDGASHIAFFEYDGASPMMKKFPGERTNQPLGFDHVSFTVNTKNELFAMKDRLDAAGFSTHGAIDHGIIWSIYFYDPNNIPLEVSWECLELIAAPAIEEDDPLKIVDEGADPQPGFWPAVKDPTPTSEMKAHSGNGKPMRDSFLARGLARIREDKIETE